MLNFVIAAVVGAVVASGVTFGAVNAQRGDDQKPVKETALYSYSDQ